MNIHLIPPAPICTGTRYESNQWPEALACHAARTTFRPTAFDFGPLSFRRSGRNYRAGSSYALVTEGFSFNPVLTQRIAQRNDGYILIIDAHRVEMASDSASGLFYALKTLEELLRSGEGNVPALTIADWADLRLRSEYLDLRTVYPKFELLLEYIAELSRYKINTLVVEYEDKLPFRKLSFLRHPELAFTEEQHRKLLAVAEQNFIRIIPKQQSFGHLEYILKHPAYIGFRETPAAVGELCPHRQGSLEMMAGILEEIAALHPGSEYLHLGCDEVWSLGTCEDCRASGLTREASFIFFVNQLVDVACGLGKKPIIWHDMLMHASDEELSALDKRVIVAVWIYGGHRMKADARHILRKLRKAGLEVLGASAVRCWDDNGDQNYPVIPNRIQNILGWVQLSQSEQLDGIIHTNWACPFSLGSPYGLFETSRYPAFSLLTIAGMFMRIHALI
jgi:hexosaminidase